MSGAELDRAASVLAEGGVVAFTGAGVSAESGIPTFRDPGGLWDRFDPAEFGTWDGLARTAVNRPDALADFLSDLRRAFAGARPGPGHVALAELEEGGVLRAVITQNVDGLHQEAGSKRVIELHGTFRCRACLVCGVTEPISRETFLEDTDRAIAGLRSAFVPSLAAVLPRCSACGGPARPDFVAFGDAVRHYEEAEALVRGARAVLVVGTSGEVFPAARLPAEARSAGAVIVEVAAGPTFIEADHRVSGPAGPVLTELAERIRLVSDSTDSKGRW